MGGGARARDGWIRRIYGPRRCDRGWHHSGNLAYHYKTKRELIRAVITSMIAEYARQIDDFLDGPSSESRDAFVELVAWLIHDSTTPVTSRLFRELWAMALHDPFIQEAVESLYAKSAMRMVNVLRKSHPELGATEAKEIVYLLLMICEGTNPIYGTCPRKGAPITKVSKLAIAALLLLVKGSRSSTILDRHLASGGTGGA